jgi:DegV family protein with EDD domain
LGKEIAQKENRQLRIAVIDSQGVTIWQALAALAARRAAAAGSTLEQVADKVHETIRHMRALALLNTLAYAVKGGRMGRAIAAVESVISVKSLLTLREGEVKVAGFVRTRWRGMERLREMFRLASHVEDLAIAYGTVPEEAADLAQYAKSLYPSVEPRLMRVGPAIGTHGGPETVIAVVSQARLNLPPLATEPPTSAGLA